MTTDQTEKVRAGESPKVLTKEEMLKATESLKTHAWVLFSERKLSRDERNWIGNSAVDSANDMERFIEAHDAEIQSQTDRLLAERKALADKIGALAIYQETTVSMTEGRKSHPFLINRAKYTLADLKALEADLESTPETSGEKNES